MISFLRVCRVQPKDSAHSQKGDHDDQVESQKHITLTLALALARALARALALTLALALTPKLPLALSRSRPQDAKDPT